MRVALFGTGWLGQPIAQALPGPVVAASRSGWADAPPHVTALPLDVTTAFDPTPFADVDAAVLALAPGVGRRSGADAEAQRRALYVEGTRRVLASLPAACRVVFLGSTAALADRDAWLDEDDVAIPDEPRGQTQRDAEALVLARPGSLVLRLGGLYGPGRELTRIYFRGEGVRAGDGSAPVNLIHQRDAVAAVLAALTRPNVRGIVHVVSDDHPSRRTLIARIAARIGASEPDWAQPPAPAPRGKRILNGRLKRELGLRLQHPLPDAPAAPCANGSGD